MNESLAFPDTSDILCADSLRLDPDREIQRVAEAIRVQVLKVLRRRGAVVGLSGGIDSSVTAGLCVRALGANKILGVLMPETDSDPDSLRLGRDVADKLGIATVVEDIAPQLAAAGCYTRRDECIRKLVPDFGEDWGCKVVLANALATTGYNITSLVVQSPSGEVEKLRMPLDVYLGIVAATNMKQRTRKQLEYYHADRLNYAVAGTPNRLEDDQGFFVKNGDGAADFKPIAHLYKSQVYQLAASLDIPAEILRRPPTTDTWSLAQSQDEFYFSLPYEKMDLCLFGLDHGFPIDDVASAAGLGVERVKLAWVDIERKRHAAAYLHAPAMRVVDDVAKAARTECGTPESQVVDIAAGPNG